MKPSESKTPLGRRLREIRQRIVASGQPLLDWDGVDRELRDLTFDPPLDAGIYDAVVALREHGVETFESCEGGAGHAYPEPTVRFHGETSEGFRAFAAAMKEGLPVAELRRVWPILDNEPTGPWWEITFATVPTTGL